MQFTFCPLFSGSKGNAVFVGGQNTKILIDAGMPGRAIEKALLEIGVLPETLNGIAVTHDHTDHVKGVGVLSRKYHLPVYANERTFVAMHRTIGDIAPRNVRIFETDEEFYIGNLAVHPFSIPHDAADPVGYKVFYGGHSVATATDMGYMKKDVLSLLSGVDVLLMESNHDPNLVHVNAHYSEYLKSRILSRHGHMSNEDCGAALVSLYRTGVRQVVLGHLSPENNYPELALSTVSKVLLSAGIVPDRDMFISVAARDSVSKKYEIL